MLVENDVSTVQLQSWIDRLQAGDERARDELLNHAAARLMTLTRRMFKGYPRLNRWEQSEDVCQNASIRLWNALKVVNPRTVADFYRLAALQIRRELIDLARTHFGPEGIGANYASTPQGDSSSSQPPAFDAPDSTLEPLRVAAWAEFHAQADRLPDEERETFDLLWYQGLTQARAAELLGVSERTIKRRWLAARLQISSALDGESPG